MVNRPSHTARMPSRSASWSSVRSKFMTRFPLPFARQTEHALTDDVALDLRRARRDRQRQRAQPLFHVEVVHVERAASEDPHRQLAEPVACLGVRNLMIIPPSPVSPVVAARDTLRFVSAQSASNSAITWPSSRRSAGSWTYGASSSAIRIASTISLTNAVPRSKLNCHVRDAPPVVLGADELLGGHPHVVEEHLAELRRAEHGGDGPDLDAGEGPSAE
jgi:hypothetical protein